MLHMFDIGISEYFRKKLMLNMDMNQLTYKVRGCLFRVHSELGPGLLESIYHEGVSYELEKQGISYQTELTFPVVYDNVKLKKQFRVDIIVENQLILELKSIQSITPIDRQQVLSYLRITKLKLGMLVNFNVLNLQDGIIRVVNNL